jgi:hypothetical protein
MCCLLEVVEENVFTSIMLVTLIMHCAFLSFVSELIFYK